MGSLRKINEGLVESADGWSARVKREALEYQEGGEIAVINIGYDPSSREITVYASEIAHPRKDYVIANVKRAVMLFTGKWVVV